MRSVLCYSYNSRPIFQLMQASRRSHGDSGASCLHFASSVVAHAIGGNERLQMW